MANVSKSIYIIDMQGYCSAFWNFSNEKSYTLTDNSNQINYWICYIAHV